MEVELARGDTMINPKFRDASGKIRGHDIVGAEIGRASCRERV